MGRVLLNAMTLLSLLFCLAGIVAWGRSYAIGDIVYFNRGPRAFSVISEGGSYSFATFLYHSNDYAASWNWEAYVKWSDAATAARRMALFEWTRDSPSEMATHTIVLPQWVVPAMFGPLPAVRFSRWRRRRRLAQHRGFDVEPVTPPP